MTGVARDPTLGRFVPGSTVDRLVRRSTAPVLVVKDRPHRPYADLLVATDCSEPSRHALECALALFPEARATLFHAYRVPFEGFIDRHANQEECRAAAEAECAAFLRRARVPEAAAGRLSTLVEYGSPDELIGAYAQDERADLAVLGTHGRGGLSGFLVGSTAARLLSSLPCDVLVVRGPTPQAAAAQAGS